MKRLLLSLFFLTLFSIPAGANALSNDANVWMVKEGKHVNLIFLRDDVERILPLSMESPGHYVMLSWGDAEYYRTRKKTLKMTLRALFLPTQAAVNIRVFAHFDEAPQTSASAKLYAFSIRQRNVDLMLEKVGRAIVTSGSVTHLGENEWVGGDFYAASDHHYSILYTCNNWIGEVLKVGGLPFSKRTTQLAPALVFQHKVAWGLSRSYREKSTFSSKKVQSVKKRRVESQIGIAFE
jgi:hypothetical protein